MTLSAESRSDWRDHNWQLVYPGPLEPLQHMALDKLLLDEVAAGKRPPTLRFWEWASPAIAIGIFQSVKNEIDPDGLKKYGMTLARRISGGGAMLCEPGNTITYSIYAPKSLVAGMDFEQAYAHMDKWVLEAFAKIGVKAWYQPLNDIASKDGKIGGAAQARHADAVLHHVTMAYDMDANQMTEVLRIGREKLSDKGTKSAEKRVDPVRRQTGMSREAVIEQMISTFRERHGLQNASLTAEDLARMDELVETRYGTEKWLYKVP